MGACSTKPLKSVQSWTPQAKTAFFGTGEFIPLICLPMHYLPPGLFSALAYPMFNYLFRWSDRNWKARLDKVPEQAACAPAAHEAVCVAARAILRPSCSGNAGPSTSSSRRGRSRSSS